MNKKTDTRSDVDVLIQCAWLLNYTKDHARASLYHLAGKYGYDLDYIDRKINEKWSNT